MEGRPLLGNFPTVHMCFTQKVSKHTYLVTKIPLHAVVRMLASITRPDWSTMVEGLLLHMHFYNMYR